MFSDDELHEMKCRNCGYIDCDGTCTQNKCSECGVKGDFAGYHSLGTSKKSLCVTCGEQEIEVYKISEADPGNHFFVRDIDEAVDNIKSIEWSDPGQGYMIIKETMPLLKYESLEEFQGF